MQREKPQATNGSVLLRVSSCGVCRTGLHIVDGDLPPPDHAMVPGHEIVGFVKMVGSGVGGIRVGDPIGVPWLGWICGHCRYRTSGRENLCDSARFTGHHIDGGYADYAVAEACYCFPIPPHYTGTGAAPLLCAGMSELDVA